MPGTTMCENRQQSKANCHYWHIAFRPGDAEGSVLDEVGDIGRLIPFAYPHGGFVPR
ncbi:MAG: hypothetical protein ACR2J5_04490 [Geodermatophilaceae bacterium]|jgi:hypothetical protein